MEQERAIAFQAIKAKLATSTELSNTWVEHALKAIEDNVQIWDIGREAWERGLAVEALLGIRKSIRNAGTEDTLLFEISQMMAEIDIKIIHEMRTGLLDIPSPYRFDWRYVPPNETEILLDYEEKRTPIISPPKPRSTSRDLWQIIEETKQERRRLREIQEKRQIQKEIKEKAKAEAVQVELQNQREVKREEILRSS